MGFPWGFAIARRPLMAPETTIQLFWVVFDAEASNSITPVSSEIGAMLLAD